MICKNSEVSAAYANGGNRSVETKILACAFGGIARNVAGNTTLEFKFDAAVGRVAGVNLVGDDLPRTVGPQDEKPVIEGGEVEIALGAGAQAFTFLDDVTNTRYALSNLDRPGHKNDASRIGRAQSTCGQA